jgi:hypothetical protein
LAEGKKWLICFFGVNMWCLTGSSLVCPTIILLCSTDVCIGSWSVSVIYATIQVSPCCLVWWALRSVCISQPCLFSCASGL